MQALLKALSGAKHLSGQVGNVLKGGTEIATGGSGALVGSGGKAGAIKKLLLANKGGAAALGGAGAAGIGGAGYAAAEALDDESPFEEGAEDLLKRLGLK